MYTAFTDALLLALCLLLKVLAPTAAWYSFGT